MKNSNMPAMPQSCTEMGYPCNWGNGESQVPMGLTKREMFAMHAMSAMLSSKFVSSFCRDGMGNYDENYSEMHQGISIEAVSYADALLKELEK